MYRHLNFASILLVLSFSYLGFSQAAISTMADERLFYAEPDVGLVPTYGVKIKTDGGGKFTDDGQGFSAGANLGWQIEYVHIIWGLRGGILKSAEDSNLSYSYQEAGAGLGWEWNIPLMTTVMFVGGRVTSDAGGGSNSISGGFGIRAALSYFLTESMKFNVSYTSMGFDQEVSGFKVKTSLDTVLASFSFPFEVPYPQDWWRNRRRTD
jgi:hypothetical protein